MIPTNQPNETCLNKWSILGNDLFDPWSLPSKKKEKQATGPARRCLPAAVGLRAVRFQPGSLGVPATAAGAAGQDTAKARGVRGDRASSNGAN